MTASNPSWLTWPVLLLIAAAIGLGLWLLRRGWWPKRIGEAPHCAACEYLLVGLEGAERCPECGSTLAGSGIVYGERHRRAWVGLIGLFLLLLSIAFLIASGPLAQVPWYHYRPFAWVLKDLDVPALQPTASAEVRRRLGANALSNTQVSAWMDHLIARAGPLDQLEWADVAARSADGKLSAAQQHGWARRLLQELDGRFPDNRRAANELLRLAGAHQLAPDLAASFEERAFKEQASPGALPAVPQLVEYLGARFAEHMLSPEQERRFLANANQFTLEVRPAVGRDDMVPYHVTTGGQGPATWRRRVRCVGVCFDDRKVSDGGFSTTSGFGGGWSGSAITHQPPGRHTMREKIEVTLAPTDGTMDGKSYLHQSTLELTASFEVLDGEVAVKLVTSPDAATMARCVRAEQFYYEQSQYDRLSGTVYIERSPVDVAFEVFARLPDGKEYKLGTVAATTGSNGGFSIGVHKDPPPFAPRIDVILRSSEAAARETTGITQIWKGEVVVKGVSVKPPATRPAK